MSTETTPKHSNDEVDILQIFKLIGDGIKKALQFFYNLIYNIFVFIIQILMFLKRNILYIVGAALLGFGLSYFLERNNLPIYEGEAIVEPNFQTELELRSRIDQFNLLLAEENHTQLAEDLNIDVDQASEIIYFEMNPIYSLNKQRYDYYDYIYEKDSTLSKTFTFDMYLENMRFEDYPEFAIRIVSLNQHIYKDLGNSIWDFSDSENIKKRQQFLTESYRVNKKYLENTLKSIDSTRSTLRQVMISEANKNSNATTTFDLGSNSTYSERPELYNYEKELRLELMQVIRAIEGTNEVVNVTKNFPKSGRLVLSSQRNNIIIAFVSAVIVILLLISLVKYLSKAEKNKVFTYRKL